MCVVSGKNHRLESMDCCEKLHTRAVQLEHIFLYSVHLQTVNDLHVIAVWTDYQMPFCRNLLGLAEYVHAMHDMISSIKHNFTVDV